MIYWWERLKNVSKTKKVMDFMREFNFSTKVSALPVYAYINGEYVEIPNHQVCVREDLQKPLYVVKKRFKLLNNDDCFKIADLFKSEYKNSKFVSCGDILNGKKSYLTILIDEVIICDDDFLAYVTITNGFDGRNAVNCILTLVRKKDNSVLQIEDESHRRIWTMSRINPSLKFNIIKQNIDDYLNYIRQVCEKLYNKKIILNEIVNKMFDLDWKKSKRINKHIAEEKEYIRQIYMECNGENLYDLYFAISNYYCNHKLKRIGKLGDDIRFDFAMCGYFYRLHDYEKYLLKFINN